MSVKNRDEYQTIKSAWKDKKAKRSGVPYMNHIDEGLKILDAYTNKYGYIINTETLGPSSRSSSLCMTETIGRAYCLHGLLQSDEDLKLHYRYSYGNSKYDFNKRAVMILAMEYRWIANSFLSPHLEVNPNMQVSDIKLSVLEEVNYMLIADKVQNYKDFEQFHKDTHSKSKLLTRYFEMWLERLGVSKYKYEELKGLIS